jgi:hypothetical protein
MTTMKEEFDRFHKIGKRLKMIFERDGLHHEGEEDYLVRSVEEATRLTTLAPDLGWVCGKCRTFNDDRDSHCRFCDTPRLSG